MYILDTFLSLLNRIIEEKREKENSGFNNDILLMFRHRTCFEQIHYSLSTNQKTNDQKQLQIDKESES